MITISEVLLVGLTVGFLIISNQVNNDHSQLTYLKNVKPEIKKFCEYKAKKAYYEPSLLGPDANELLVLENCIKSLDTEAIKNE